MKTTLLLLGAASVFSISSACLGMTALQYTSQKDTIASDYKSNRANCRNLNKNAKISCRLNAKGTRDLAKAKLESTYEISAGQTEALVAKK